MFTLAQIIEEKKRRIAISFFSSLDQHQKQKIGGRTKKIANFRKGLGEGKDETVVYIYSQHHLQAIKMILILFTSIAIFIDPFQSVELK